MKSEANGPDLEHWNKAVDGEVCILEICVAEELVMAELEAPFGHWGRKILTLSLPKACLQTVFQASHPHDCPCSRFMTDAARREQESLKKKIQPKLSLTLSSTVSRGNVSTPPRHSSGSLTPPVTPPITPSSSFRSSTPTGKHLLFGLSQIN